MKMVAQQTANREQTEANSKTDIKGLVSGNNTMAVGAAAIRSGAMTGTLITHPKYFVTLFIEGGLFSIKFCGSPPLMNANLEGG